jgi:hypothetical protein
MVLDLFGKSRSGGGLNALMNRGAYEKAIAQIKTELQKRRKDERLRLQLADLLAQAGRPKEAVEVLNQLSDDLAWDGFAAKAIAVLKKIEKLDPGRSDVDEKLSYLINQKSRPTNDPWAMKKPAAESEEGELEIGMGSSSSVSAPAAAAPAPAPAPPVAATPAPKPLAQPTPAPKPPAAKPAAAPAPAAASPDEELEFPDAAATGGEDVVQEEEFRSELLSLIEDVFVAPAPAAEGPSAPAGEGSPMVDTPLFRNMSQGELLAVIRKMRLLMFEPGEVIFFEGQVGESLYIITTGKVRAYVRDGSGAPKEVRQLGEGDFFGEISVLEGGKRTATVTTADSCELLEFDKASLDEIARTHPNVLKVMREFAQKRAARTDA